MSDQLLEFRDMLRSRGTGGRSPDRETRRLLMYLFTSTRGGPTRLRIVGRLMVGPLNTHQLALDLGMDYKAVQHHMKVLSRNNMVSRDGDRYGAIFRLSAFLELHMDALADAVETLSRKMSRKKVYM